MTDFSITIYDECPVCKMPMNPMHEKNSDCGKTEIYYKIVASLDCDECLGETEICPRCGDKWTKPDEVPCGCHNGDKYICWGATGGDLYIGLQTEEYMEMNYDEWGIFNELIDER